jgi:hypothetical protein
MSAGVSLAHGGVVTLDLDFGSYDLGIDECGELIRVLAQRGRRNEGGAAVASARRLEALFERDAAHVGVLSEDELDAIADAAWEWHERVGSGAFPERVLLVLDALRARHARE